MSRVNFMLLFTGQNLLRIYPAFTFMDCAKHTKKSTNPLNPLNHPKGICFKIILIIFSICVRKVEHLYIQNPWRKCQGFCLSYCHFPSKIKEVISPYSLLVATKGLCSAAVARSLLLYVMEPDQAFPYCWLL